MGRETCIKLKKKKNSSTFVHEIALARDRARMCQTDVSRPDCRQTASTIWSLLDRERYQGAWEEFDRLKKS